MGPDCEGSACRHHRDQELSSWVLAALRRAKLVVGVRVESLQRLEEASGFQFLE